MNYSNIMLEQLNNFLIKYIFKLCTKIKYKPNYDFPLPSILFFPIKLVIMSASQICFLLFFPYDKFRPLSFPTRFTTIVFNVSIYLPSPSSNQFCPLPQN